VLPTLAATGRTPLLSNATPTGHGFACFAQEANQYVARLFDLPLRHAINTPLQQGQTPLLKPNA
jgi:hypothetical protein